MLNKSIFLSLFFFAQYMQLNLNNPQISATVYSFKRGDNWFLGTQREYEKILHVTTVCGPPQLNLPDRNLTPWYWVPLNGLSRASQEQHGHGRQSLCDQGHKPGEGDGRDRDWRASAGCEVLWGAAWALPLAASWILFMSGPESVCV